MVTRLFYKLIFFPSILAFHIHLVRAPPPQTLCLACLFTCPNRSQTLWALVCFPTVTTSPPLPACPPTTLGFLSLKNRRLQPGVVWNQSTWPLLMGRETPPEQPQLLQCQKTSLSKPLVDVQLNAQHSTVYSALLYHHLHSMGKNTDMMINDLSQLTKFIGR